MLKSKTAKGLSRTIARGSVVAIASCLMGAPLGAQEITQRFINPSFGGNPFNSEHLLATASIDRPKAPSSKSSQLSQQELLARQIQSRVLSSLSSAIVQAITGADPGDSGEFVVGDQRIVYERTETELRLTIFNDNTGETTEIVLPVLNTNATGMAANGTGEGALLTGGEGSLIADLGITAGGAGQQQSSEGGLADLGGLDTNPIKSPF